LLARYKADLRRGLSGSSLASLKQQIQATAKAAGMHVNLPASTGASVVAASTASTEGATAATTPAATETLDLKV
jgi:hypothetical protein